MKYPDDFNTPAFPAGKFIAVSRFMGTAVMVIFFLIICMCGVIFWVKKTQDVSPFLISFTDNGERWEIVAHDNHKTEIPAYYVLQESLLNKFARDWFTIRDSDNIFVNQAVWSGDCTRDSMECRENMGDGVGTCAIYCACNDSVFGEFQKVVLPIYSDLEMNHAATWTVQSLDIKPMDSIKFITELGGKWKLKIHVKTNTGWMYFIGYATVSYDENQYPKTLGYYVSEFNTYRIN